MRRMTFGVTVGLLALAGSALADSPIVRWDRIDGVNHGINPVGETLTVGGITSSPRSFSTDGGNVMLNLATGFISIQVEHLSMASHYDAADFPSSHRPLGSPSETVRKGTIVCDSTGTYDDPEIADTGVFEMLNGTGSYRGIITVPQGCQDRPDEIVFLLRNAASGNPHIDVFVAYGTARTIE